MKTKSTTDFSNKQKYYTGRDNILQFFLNIFRVQTGASEQEPSKYIHLSSHSLSGLDDTYELYVAHDGEWNSRRMTIAPLGDGSGSKSMCFKVIYDDLLVIKIPPVAISDFDEYISNINFERSIAEKLMSNIECITPELSAVLRKVPPFVNSSDLPPDQLESMCLRYLKKYPRYQELLKIGDSFVFFMNLSKNSFLSQVLDNMHNMNHKIHQEIVSHSDILWNMMAFENKFGGDCMTIFFGINEVFTRYEEDIKALLKQYGMMYSVPSYQIKDWFLLHLADSSIDEHSNQYPEDFFAELNDLFKRVLRDYKDEIRDYREMIRSYVNKVSFSQNRLLFGGVITNLLDLLYWLRIKCVAIRDLKPDNLFIVGDVTKSPFLLARAEDYSLGLIDFETAVIYDSKDNKEIPQPMLAGTPSYATPAHLFTNELLASVYDDLPRILHLQDWQAVIGMIFSIVTGERLFDKTRKKLSEIRNIIRISSLQKKSLADAYKISCHHFWNSAFIEFKEKTVRYEKKLKSVECTLNGNIQNMLKDEITNSKTHTINKMKQLIMAQQLFKTDKARRDLLKSSRVAITKCRINWQTNKNVPETRPMIRNKIIHFLGALERQKIDYEQQVNWLQLFSEENCKISAYDLLQLMFKIVYRDMYQENWAQLVSDIPKIVSSKKLQEDKEVSVSEEETVAFEKTISYE